MVAASRVLLVARKAVDDVYAATLCLCLGELSASRHPVLQRAHDSVRERAAEVSVRFFFFRHRCRIAAGAFEEVFSDSWSALKLWAWYTARSLPLWCMLYRGSDWRATVWARSCR